MRIKRVLITGVLLAVSSAAVGQVPLRSTSQNPLYPAQSLAIAGVKLGMAPPEVAIALTAAGYTRAHQDVGENWDVRISRLIAMERGGVHVPASGRIVRREEYRRGEEQLEVEYDATPHGAAVASVRYDVGAAMDTARFREAVLARYGTPTRPGDSRIMYCSAGEIACTPLAFPAPAQEPNIVVDVYDHAITLNMGVRRAEERGSLEKAEMERRAPKVKRPNF
jgi:hypothetical protein